ncbi:translation factor Sua5 [beta proteobacterium AAP99]|nr:translation factor Sua5 [beta proteobacterium AAP99]
MLRITVHPDNPERRLLKQVAGMLMQGGVVAIPTDSSYALVCHLDDKVAADRLRKIRGVDERHHLTVLCADLHEIAQFSKVDNAQYRLLKQLTPGPYTFILEATKEVPRRVSHPSRKTIGIRVPEHPVTNTLLAEFDAPVLSTTLIPAGESDPLNDPDDIESRFKGLIDAFVDAGACPREPTTVIDLSGRTPELIRQGRGSVDGVL